MAALSFRSERASTFPWRVTPALRIGGRLQQHDSGVIPERLLQ
jgi:hypothetical protein